MEVNIKELLDSMHEMLDELTVLHDRDKAIVLVCKSMLNTISHRLTNEFYSTPE